MFKYYLDWLLNDEATLKSQQRFKSVHDNTYTKQINKTALSSNYGKRLERFGKITTYPYWTNAFKVCENETLGKYKWLILMIVQMQTKPNVI